jgi:hypothetical protein
VIRFTHFRSDVPDAPVPWVIEYGTLSIDCRDEADAKKIVRGLHQRGSLVARTAFGVLPGRRLEGEDLANWLSE